MGFYRYYWPLLVPFLMYVAQQKPREAPSTDSSPDPGSRWGLDSTRPDEVKGTHFIQISSSPLKPNFE